MKEDFRALIKDSVFITILVLTCLGFALFLSVLEEANQHLSRTADIVDTFVTTNEKVSSLCVDSIVTETIIVNPVIEVPVSEYEDY